MKIILKMYVYIKKVCIFARLIKTLKNGSKNYQ